MADGHGRFSIYLGTDYREYVIHYYYSNKLGFIQNVDISPSYVLSLGLMPVI